MCDTFYQAFVNGYLVLSSAGAEMRSKTLAARNLLYAFRMTTIIFCFLHSLYFLTVPNCGRIEIKLVLVVYTFLLLTLYPVDFKRRADVNANYASHAFENGTAKAK